jgi:hypothetical protein
MDSTLREATPMLADDGDGDDDDDGVSFIAGLVIVCPRLPCRFSFLLVSHHQPTG